MEDNPIDTPIGVVEAIRIKSTMNSSAMSSPFLSETQFSMCLSLFLYTFLLIRLLPLQDPGEISLQFSVPGE